MKPAVLFSGDVTCYVLWAVNRDGVPENLGELWVQSGKEDDSIEFQTGLRNFALMVTAEEYYQVPKPSQMILFWNDGKADPPVQSSSLVFNELAPAPSIGVQDVGPIKYSGKKPVDLVQAEKLYSLAQRYQAEEYAADLLRQSKIALDQATHMFERDRDEGSERFARRSSAASNEAISLSLRRKQKAELEAEIAERQAEMSALESRAEQAERRVEEVRSQASQLEQEKAAAEAEIRATNQKLEQIRNEREQVETALVQLRQEQQQLRDSMISLQREKEALLEDRAELQGRLQGALSKVAETRESARGFIVNLPDILFDVGKDNLKDEAKIVIAKLSGILLLMPDLNLRIEGHTDSTGTPSGNLRLSRRRADSVYDFLVGEGIEGTRITTAGYGQERPIADNSTAEGRQKNRRVELIIKEGEIEESTAD
jgi:outer membrane protein OmpA-like peptidoglycan-associated protein